MSQDKAAKKNLQFSICIKKRKIIPAALGIVWFLCTNTHGKEMLFARTLLEVTVTPGGGTWGGCSKPERVLGAVKASA